MPVKYRYILSQRYSGSTLLNFVGMAPGGFFLNYEQHIMGNYMMRLGQDAGIVERKDWLERLQPGEIAKIEAMTADYREYYTTI